MSAPSLLHRLKERKLVQWAVAYLAGAWALVEATNLVVDQFHWPEVFGQVVTVAALFGFFVTLVLAWYHGEKGRQRVGGTELLLLALLLVLAGVGMSRLGRAVAESPAQRPASARFAAFDDGRPTIAVLPLANLSADEENSYFAAGIHEELLRHLSLVRALAVISRTSVLQYAGGAKAIRDIAAEIGARYIVEGSVQEDQGRVRIQVQLIDASTDRHMWAERYDRTMANIFELQSEVAQAIATALEAVVTPDERARIEARPTENLVAYDLYLQAVELNRFVRKEYDTAVELLRRATTLDPAFALAHARLALTFRDGNIVHRAVPFDSAVTRANLAVELNPRLPEALTAKGYLLAEMGQDEAAHALLLQALTLDPSNALTWTRLAFAGWASGDNVGGVKAALQAMRLDPKTTLPLIHMGYSLSQAGMIAEGALWFERALDDESTRMWALHALSFGSMLSGDRNATQDYIARMRQAGADNLFVLYFTGLLEIFDGNAKAAETALDQVVSASSYYSNSGFPTAEALLGWAIAQSRQAEGREQLESLRRRRTEQVAGGYSSITACADLTIIASVIGDEDEQLRWFLEAARLDDRGMLGLTHAFTPWLDRIRHRRDFQSWLRETEEHTAAQQRELAAMGEWTPEAVLANKGS